MSDDTVPPWLITMRVLSGTEEAPGSADNPTIMGWADEIGRRFPDMAPYSREYTHDSIPWCGLTVAYCVAVNGIRPPFGATDTDRFLWANAWSRWGTKTDPRLGCIMVFTRNGGGHVALYEGEDDTSYIVRGGNQSDAVNVTHMPKSQFTAAVWPPDPQQSQSSDDRSGKGSWYSQYQGKYSWIDKGDGKWDETGTVYLGPNNAFGVPDDEQGCSFYDRSTLGEWFDVTAPNGVTLRLQQTDIGPNPKTGRLIDIAAVAAERFGYTPRNFPTDEIFSWRPATESAAVPNHPPVLVPSSPRVDANVFADLFKQLGPIIADQIKAELAKPETQAAVKGAVATLLPKLLSMVSSSVPGAGILIMVAGWVLPLMFPDVMGSDAGMATIVSGAGITSIPIVNKVMGVLDRVKELDKATFNSDFYRNRG